MIQGPNLTNSLIGVLVRFCQENVAIMADIEKMFHQVKIAPQDIDFLCFLWWPDGNIIQDMREYRMTVHLFGAASSSSCASYALKRAAEDNKDSSPAEVIDSVHRNFYVNDLLKSVDTESHAIALYKELKDVCARGVKVD